MLESLSKENRGAIKGTSPKQVLEDVQAMKKEAREARLITPAERKSLELRLHRLLVWVGVMTPFEFELGGKKLPLHDIVWDLLAKECLTEDEKSWVRKLIRKLTVHVKADEEILHNNQLTVEEAKEIYREAAGLMRAIMSLKAVVGEKDYCPVRKTQNKRRIEDAQYWLNFLRQIT